MPSNIEIKAHVRDFNEICRRAEQLSGIRAEVIPQEDTFFNTPRGRLKLRVLSKRKGNLSITHARIRKVRNVQTIISL